MFNRNEMAILFGRQPFSSAGPRQFEMQMAAFEANIGKELREKLEDINSRIGRTLNELKGITDYSYRKDLKIELAVLTEDKKKLKKEIEGKQSESEI